MKILKKLGIGILILVGLAAVIGFFMPSKYQLERSMDMKAAPAVIYEQLATLKNWEKWSPWQKMDPDTKLTYNDIASGKGATYSWDGPKLGQGELTITECYPDTFVLTSLNFKGSGQGMASFSIQPMEGGMSKVTWKMWSDIGMNPFKRLMNQLMKGMMNKAFDDGLAAIKDIAEKAPAPTASNIAVEVKELAGRPYLFVHDSADLSSIGQKLGANYGKIMGVMQQQKIEQAGAPFAIYYTNSETNWVFDACIPVNKAGKDEGAVKAGTQPAGSVVVAKFFGNYDKTPAAHNAAHAYIEANGKTIIGAPWEEYVTDPMMEKDTAKWQTNVCYPVK